MNAIRVSSQRTNRWIRLSVVLAALVVSFWIGFIGLAQPRSDRVIKRDGSSVTGHLDSVDEANVTVDGHAIPRSEVKAILFAGAKTTAGPAQSSSNTSGTNLTDLVVKRVGGSSYGHVSQVTSSVVVQSGKQLSRGTVASIQFNISSPRSEPTPWPSPSPSPSASASASPSSSPSPSTSPDSGVGGKNDQPSSGSGDNKSGSGGDRTSPPRPTPKWLGDCGDEAKTVKGPKEREKPKEGFNSCVGMNWTMSGPEFVRCQLTVYFCGLEMTHHLDVRNKGGSKDDKEPIDQLRAALGVGQTICCDQLKDARKSKKPCDPGVDLDCDSIPNDKDDFPFDPNCSRWGDPCSEKYKKKN